MNFVAFILLLLSIIAVSATSPTHNVTSPDATLYWYFGYFFDEHEKWTDDLADPHSPGNQNLKRYYEKTIKDTLIAGRGSSKTPDYEGSDIDALQFRGIKDRSSTYVDAVFSIGITCSGCSNLIQHDLETGSKSKTHWTGILVQPSVTPASLNSKRP